MSALQAIAQTVYTQTKTTLTDVLDSYKTSSDAVVITLVITDIIKTVQVYKINGTSLTSAEKESVAVMAGRLLLVDLKGSDSPVLVIYDESAPILIKGIVEVGKFFKQEIEVVIQKFGCCRSGTRS